MSTRPPKSVKPVVTTLMVRLDQASKDALVSAAALRKMNVSHYVRTVTVAQARKEVSAAESQTIALSPTEQLEFWAALQNVTNLTLAQKKLGKIMRGEA